MTFILTWYGHAAFSIAIDGFKLLLDPTISDNPAATVNADDQQADFILISHGHADHVEDAIAIARQTGATVISNFEIACWCEEKGIQANGQHIGGGCHYPFGYLKLTQACHGSSLRDGTYGGNPAGFLLSTKQAQKIYFACDTGLFGDMRLIGEEGVDLAVLPIGDHFAMGPKDALRAVKLIQPKHVIPVHFNTFEIIQQDPDSWAKRVEAETEARPHILKPGESFTL
jgi:L-ascorbate metabolism protein UlaG (beta-lactamase superfamily)